MPREVFDMEEFIKLSERASHCRVKRLKEVVKLKIRTPKTLYTLKVNPERAAEIMKRLRCEIVEV